MSKIAIDIQLFFVSLANSIIAFPPLRKSFEEFYSTDKYRFYERATRSPYYNEYNMSGKTLPAEVAMRRVFGILQCAEEDESSRDFACRELMNTNKRFEELVKNPKKTDIDTFVVDTIKQMKNMPDSYDAKTAPCYFLAYLLYATYGTGSDNQVVNDYLSHTHKMILEMNKRKTLLGTPIGQGLKINGTEIPKTQQSIIKKLKSGFDLLSFIEFNPNSNQNIDRYSENPELHGYINAYYNSGRYESSDLRSASAIIGIATSVTNTFGVDLFELNGPVSITKDEQNMIIKRLADMAVGATASELRYFVNMTNYVIGHIFVLLAKEIRNMKEFYFKNNSETQYLELQRLENAVTEKDVEIGCLRAELARANALAEQQREEIRRLTDEIFKENKDAVKPYQSEISGLNSRIKEFEAVLEAEQAKNSELNALREFAFEAQSEYIPPETTVTLAELARGKKIIVVGGHINWRNKMKRQYPAITFIDGHNVSLDVSVFDNADFTLLNTANMSHKLYYKVIGYLRDKKLRFNYLGRSNNPELLEAEIVSILQEKMCVSETA